MLLICQMRVTPILPRHLTKLSSIIHHSLNMTQLSKDLEATTEIWQLNDAHNVDALATSLRAQAEHSDVLDAIDICINSSSDNLRKLSIQIHGKWAHLKVI